ncbi:Head binding [Yersinia massiliensis]|uniref:phage tailspike protein n=1 Tax=Yersinia massiliensis TaxID=419257 RepID=UPI0005E738F4|nr:phage tailspike protein [Yersinia massiliensis]CNH80632.1 Head binding [Yersinia massiliensis]
MPDIIPNVVVSMPSQLFTMPRKFAAVFGGRIYIGLIDTDPTIPSNQIQVYLENEDGSLVPMAQPILINAGGYPVYNGQVSKFVTVQGHSMAVYDALNVQQFYFPNVLKYDPDQFRQYLDSQGGAVTVDMLGSYEDGKGDELVGVKQPFTGTIGRTQHGVNLERRSVFDFPGTWDGVADDTVGFQAAVNSFGLIGGTLHIPNIAKVYLAGAVTIPGGVSISGDMKCPGSPGLPHLLGNIFKLGSQIRINPAITVSLGGGNAINNVVITRSTMTGPEVNAANYGGIAFTQIGADVRFDSVMCIGFTHLISCKGFARTVLTNSGIDTIGGVSVTNAGDPAHVMDNHFWPYGTASAAGLITTPDTNHFIYRSGTAVRIDGGAWPIVVGNFILGHADQVAINNSSNPRVIGNGFSGINLGDVSPYVIGNTGLRIEGTTNNSIIDGNVSVHLEHGLYLIPTSTTGRNTITNQTCRNVKTTGVVILSGNASVQANVEGRIDSSAGVRVIGATSKVLIDGCQLYNNLNAIQAEGTGHIIGKNTFIGNANNVLETSGPFSIPATVTNMAITPDFDFYYVSGSVSNISHFKDTFNGHIITLTFAGACSMVSTGNLRLSSSPLNIPAGSTIQFLCFGQSGSRTWRQLTAPL